MPGAQKTQPGILGQVGGKLFVRFQFCGASEAREPLLGALRTEYRSQALYDVALHLNAASHYSHDYI